jgi:hypothetical protein
MTDEPDLRLVASHTDDEIKESRLFIELRAEEEARSAAGLLKRLTAIFEEVAGCMDDGPHAHFPGLEAYTDLATVVEFLESSPDLSVAVEGLHWIAAAIRMRKMWDRSERLLKDGFQPD